MTTALILTFNESASSKYVKFHIENGLQGLNIKIISGKNLNIIPYKVSKMMTVHVVCIIQEEITVYNTISLQLLPSYQNLR